MVKGGLMGKKKLVMGFGGAMSVMIVVAIAAGLYCCIRKKGCVVLTKLYNNIPKREKKASPSSSLEMISVGSGS